MRCGRTSSPCPPPPQPPRPDLPLPAATSTRTINITIYGWSTRPPSLVEAAEDRSYRLAVVGHVGNDQVPRQGDGPVVVVDAAAPVVSAVNGDLAVVHGHR